VAGPDALRFSTPVEVRGGGVVSISEAALARRATAFLTREPLVKLRSSDQA
jgi:hypothetical protein